MPGVRFFFVMRILRGGDGHWRDSNDLEGCWTYEGFIRSGRSVMDFMVHRGVVVVKARVNGRVERPKGCNRGIMAYCYVAVPESGDVLPDS